MQDTNPTDRYPGLLLFGAVEILLGLVCVGLALMAAGRAELAAQHGIADASAAVAPGLAVYGLAAIGFVTLGTGSIRARRWARALTVAVSGVWLAGGTVATVALLIVLPRLTGTLSPVDPGPASGAAIAGALIGLIMIPLGLLLFYGNAAVRRTFEERDRKGRWTDRVPLPILAVIVVMSFAAVAMIASMGNPVLPVLGTVMTGAPASLTFLSLGILCGYVAVQLYRLRESAWWILVLLQVAGLAIGMLSLIRGRGTADADHHPLLIALFIGTWLVYFAFLLYLRRYFMVGLVPRTRRDD